MFSNLDEHKLSSKHQQAYVFSYSGATVKGICDRFSLDNRKDKIQPSKVENIVLMCGSNNIDLILDSPRHMRSNLIQPNCSPNTNAINQTKTDIEDLIISLHDWAPRATICFLNILPRESLARNMVISDINRYISKLPDQHRFVKFISTAADRYLFSNREGYRKSHYFSVNGDDNVHLNYQGVIRLARHIKYNAHNC